MGGFIINIEQIKNGNFIPIKIWCDKIKSEDRIILDEIVLYPESIKKYTKLVCLAILYPVTDDFCNEETNKIYRDTDSYQIRPKIVHKNKNGLFVETKEGRNYLSQTYIDWLKNEFTEYSKFL